MNKYYFETNEFGVSDDGIHLLRSRFNYKTIDFNQVDQLTIEKGKELNNWIVVLVIGLLLVSFAFFYTTRLSSVLYNNQVSSIYIEEIIVPLFPFLVGGYCMYISTRNGTILRLRKTMNKSDKFSLKELDKRNELESFQKFIKGKLSNKVIVK